MGFPRAGSNPAGCENLFASILSSRLVCIFYVFLEILTPSTENRVDAALTALIMSMETHGTGTNHAERFVKPENLLLNQQKGDISM